MRPELSRFYPSKEWLDRVGNIISADGKQTTRDVVMQEGFNTFKTSEGVFKADSDLLRGAKLIKGDETGEKYFSQLLDSSDCFGMDAIIVFEHYKLKSLKTSYGKLVCHYKLSKRCRSELLCREARKKSKVQLVKLLYFFNYCKLKEDLEMTETISITETGKELVRKSDITTQHLTRRQGLYSLNRGSPFS